MKKRNLFLTLGLALGLGVGVAAGLGARGLEAKEVDAVSNTTFYLNTNGYGDDSWADYALWAWGTGSEGAWIKMAATGTENYFSAVVDLDTYQSCKFVRYQKGNETPDWSWDSSDSDLSLNSATNLYTLSGRSGGKLYGSWSAYVDPAAPITVTLKVVFSTEVPSYANIYLPGSFNGWNVASGLMTTTDRLNYTYQITKVPGDFTYKVVADYNDAAEPGYTLEITPSNQNLTIVAGDAGTVKTIQSGLVCNLSEATVADGANFTIQFNSAVPEGIDLYFPGSLFGWNAAKTNTKKFTPNVGRTSFTFTFDPATHTSDLEYGIIAMSSRDSAENMSWTYKVYPSGTGNAELELDTSTVNYTLGDLKIDYNFDQVKALYFAQGFLGAMAAKCTDENADNASGVSSIWTTWKTEYEGLTANQRTAFKNASAEAEPAEEREIARARVLYLHVLNRYSLTAWTDGPSGLYSIGALNNETNNITPIVIILVSAIGLIAVGSIFVIRRRKENN